MKVCLWPSPETMESNHGIGRIIHAQYKYLPDLGIEFVEPEQADVIACHTQQFDMPNVDVLHIHGLYWTGDPGSGEYNRWHHLANARIVEAARRSRLITVPSPWTAEVFKRDMRVTPITIGHGIDFNQWEPGDTKNYILWNKNRNDDVCDPTPALELALRGVRVVSTFLPRTKSEVPPTMNVVGALSHERMKLLIQSANIYLATVKETYGIGTLEAMACGVPVLGYRHGGTADIVQHLETGYLAEPGNIEDLMAGIEYISNHRAALSANARAFAATRDWPNVIGEYAKVYEQALALKQQDNSRVSFVITNYNYGQYVAQAIHSAEAQTINCEIVVVDDGSTDNSRAVIQQIADENSDYVRPIFQENKGVAAARNAGIMAARGEYIICLDADDIVDPNYANVLRNAMEEDRGLGVAYTGLGLISPEGIRPNEWPPEFDWVGQTVVHNPPSNCVPCAAMFRKDMWRRAGGYKQEYAPGEDTEFWTRGLSVGYTAARITPDYLFHYRPHEGGASRTKKYIPIDAFLPWMRDKLYPMGVPLRDAVPNITSYSTPSVSVIIPVGSGHEKYLPRALDSVLGQNSRKWEVIVIWDDDDHTLHPDMTPYPFVKQIYVPGPKRGSSVARNLGIDSAKAPLIMFLDADDWLLPDAISSMCAAYERAEGRYVYSDWLAVMSGKVQKEEVPEYEAQAFLTGPQHGITALMATDDARQIRFDESLTVLEDWDFFARCAIAGVHGMRLPIALYAVRIHANRKTDSWKNSPERDSLLMSIVSRYSDYREGVKPMGSCCGGNGNAVMAAKQAAGMSAQAEMNPMQMASPGPDQSRVQYVGDRVGATTYGGPGITPSGQRYRGGNNAMDRFVNADPRDVQWLENTGVWKKVAAPPATPPVDAVPVDQVSQILERASVMDTPSTPMEPSQQAIFEATRDEPAFQMPLRVSDLEGASDNDPDGMLSAAPAAPPPPDGNVILNVPPRRSPGRPKKVQ